MLPVEFQQEAVLYQSLSYGTSVPFSPLSDHSLAGPSWSVLQASRRETLDINLPRQSLHFWYKVLNVFKLFHLYG